MAVLLPCLCVDSVLYGRLTFPPLNILRYNSLGGGDELYGTEPLGYYVRNLLLTLGLCWPLGAAAPLLITRAVTHKFMRGDSLTTELRQLVCCAPVVLWMLLLFPRPHKVQHDTFAPSA